jgi:hypothetical protein
MWVHFLAERREVATQSTKTTNGDVNVHAGSFALFASFVVNLIIGGGRWLH